MSSFPQRNLYYIYLPHVENIVTSSPRLCPLVIHLEWDLGVFKLPGRGNFIALQARLIIWQRVGLRIVP